jgi:hypothetical protein
MVVRWDESALRWAVTMVDRKADLSAVVTGPLRAGTKVDLLAVSRGVQSVGLSVPLNLHMISFVIIIFEIRGRGWREGMIKLTCCGSYGRLTSRLRRGLNCKKIYASAFV